MPLSQSVSPSGQRRVTFLSNGGAIDGKASGNRSRTLDDGGCASCPSRQSTDCCPAIASSEPVSVNSRPSAKLDLPVPFADDQGESRTKRWLQFRRKSDAPKALHSEACEPGAGARRAIRTARGRNWAHRERRERVGWLRQRAQLAPRTPFDYSRIAVSRTWTSPRSPRGGRRCRRRRAWPGPRGGRRRRTLRGGGSRPGCSRGGGSRPTRGRARDRCRPGS